MQDVKLKQVRIILNLKKGWNYTFNLCSMKLTAKKKYACASPSHFVSAWSNCVFRTLGTL